METSFLLFRCVTDQEIILCIFLYYTKRVYKEKTGSPHDQAFTSLVSVGM